jgi:hypothetical protein
VFLRGVVGRRPQRRAAVRAARPHDGGAVDGYGDRSFLGAICQRGSSRRRRPFACRRGNRESDELREDYPRLHRDPVGQLSDVRASHSPEIGVAPGVVVANGTRRTLLRPVTWCRSSPRAPGGGPPALAEPPSSIRASRTHVLEEPTAGDQCRTLDHDIVELAWAHPDATPWVLSGSVERAIRRVG